MKGFLIVCLLLVNSSNSYIFEDEECKATNVTADYYYGLYHTIYIGITFNPPQDCNPATYLIKFSINGEIHHIKTINEHIPVGAIEVEDHLSCKDNVEVSVVSYDEDDDELGESDVEVLVVKACKECEAEIINVEYDGSAQLVLSITPPQPICEQAASIKLKCFVNDDIIYGNTYFQDTIGIISLSEPLNCQSDIDILIETYDVNDSLIVGVPMHASYLQCDPCKASIESAVYDGNLKIFVSITTSGTDCLSTILLVKCKIDDEIIYGVTTLAMTAGIISLSEKLECVNNVEVSIIAYWKNGLEFWESNAMKVQNFDC